MEEGFEDANPTESDQRLRETRKKDVRALFLIQQALNDEIFFLELQQQALPIKNGKF